MDLAVLCLWLDLVILKIFFQPNGFYDSLEMVSAILFAVKSRLIEIPLSGLVAFPKAL